MRFSLAASALLLMATCSVIAQDRLQNMPRFDRYEKLRREISGSVVRGDLNVSWAEDGKSFTYSRGGKTFKFTVATLKEEQATGEVKAPTPTRAGRGQGAPSRGRQFDRALSPDGKMVAIYRDQNVFLADADGKNESPVTTDGSEAKRTKYGVASWVYGEELGVREAMWWSPDSKTLAYYFFDESEVKDYYLGMDQTKFQNTLDTEAYPKAGMPNPKVGLFLFDAASKKSIKVAATFASEGGPDIAHYVYSVRWSPKGDELLFNRTNRLQNVMELCAANPATGTCRVVLRETSTTGWTDNTPFIRFLEDGKRFLWVSDRNGFNNLYLADLSGKIKPITKNNFDLIDVISVDEKKGTLVYNARSAPNPYLSQAHRVKLDGTGETRLTDPAFSHRVQLSPTGDAMVDTFETVDTPPTTVLRDAKGKILKELATSDLTKFNDLQLKKTERVEFMAADGVTKCYGTLQFPSDFDPAKKYPLVVSVYGGPESGGGLERFRTPDPTVELGFLVASFDGRGTNGRGTAFKHAVYRKLGIVEIDDQAAGVKALATRPYVDGKRVGIHGSSYGGYSSAMALLRYPDVFAAACASSSVTDWRHYDTIYTERYMALPTADSNLSGYNAGSAMTYAKDLKGRLMLFFGTSDNNVHPSNTLMLAQALNRAGKSYDMMVGPDLGHAGLDFRRTWEYFIDNLILKQSSDPLLAHWKSPR